LLDGLRGAAKVIDSRIGKPQARDFQMPAIGD
jgi:hypothetical protein